MEVIQSHILASTLSRRRFVASSGLAFLARVSRLSAKTIERSLETPYKINQLVLGPSGVAGSYDELSVDSPFVFWHDQRWYMMFVGFDGIGYQTGLASSRDLIRWEKIGCILRRDPDSKVLRYNVAMNWIIRENDIGSRGRLTLINDHYVGAYHAYPSEGLEEGAAVIGLAFSKDLFQWTLMDPVLKPSDGGVWERGGLYKPCLLRYEGKYYLFYNAKNQTTGSWHEQIGLAISEDLKTWKRYQGNPVIRNGERGSLDEIFASDPCILRNGPEWAFFYFGLDNNSVARDLIATGPDLVRATKFPKPLIDVGLPRSVDSIYAHKPSVVTDKGVLYHFYCAVGGDRNNPIRGVSVARSEPW